MTMDLSSVKPWQTGPSELISYALNYMDSDSEFERRVGFLLLDVGVEELLKTYLELPAEISGSALPFSKHKEALSSNSFIQAVRTTKDAAKKKLNGIDLMELQFYHERRNSLYHQGSGISIQSDVFRKYAEIAVVVLYRLLDIDIHNQLLKNEKQSKQLEKVQKKKDEINEQLRRIEQLMGQLETSLLLAYEKVEPTIVLPSFWIEFEKWSSKVDTIRIFNYYDRIKEKNNSDIRNNEKTLEKAFDIEPNFYRLMPARLLRLAEKYDIPSRFLLINLDEDKIGFLLSLGVYILSINGSTQSDYRSADLALRDPVGRRFSITDMSMSIEDQLEQQHNECKRAVLNLQQLIAILKPLAGN